jgi:hypothetical protein
MESVDGLLVPKLRLGMPLSRQLCCHTDETEFRRQVRYQTEFGNEGLNAATKLWLGGGDGVGENRIGNKPPLRLRCTHECRES